MRLGSAGRTASPSVTGQIRTWVPRQRLKLELPAFHGAWYRPPAISPMQTLVAVWTHQALNSWVYAFADGFQAWYIHAEFESESFTKHNRQIYKNQNASDRSQLIRLIWSVLLKIWLWNLMIFHFDVIWRQDVFWRDCRFSKKFKYDGRDPGIR